MVIQLAVALVAFIETRGNFISHQDSVLWNLSISVESLGPHLKVACCLLLPPLQLVVGISHPSWVSLPFFIGSCVGLVDWSLTSNFLGLFRWWRPLLIYACFNILILHLYQLPIEFPEVLTTVADFIGLSKISMTSEWTEISSVLSLMGFFFMLSSIKPDLEEMDSAMSMQDRSVTEHLLPSNHTFFIREYRSGVRHTNVLLRRSVFRNFSINFFTYGFPVLLLALSFWSFNFASICAFGLLAYVGYILYAFPSLFHLHRLNGLLLVFILLWAACTYIFNVAFSFLNRKLSKDMEIWETIGFWHYPIPGFFLLAQFCLGILVAMGNLVNNSVFLYMSNEERQSSNDESVAEEKDDMKVLIIATLAWGLRKISRAVTLTLIFLLALKPGFIHAVYGIFFLVYLLSHSISRKIRQALILFCETHFALLYILQLSLISKTLERSSSLMQTILTQSGLKDHANVLDFLEIGILLCFCAVQNHGFKMLFSFSAIVQHTPCHPFGFSILKAGLNKSVLLSVYTSPKSRDSHSLDSLHEKWIATYLSEVGEKFLSAYRSYGTYVAFLTILFTVYLVNPNYISFGYLFFLLFWIIGRQLVEKTRRRLWFPLKLYATIVFIFIYSLSISTSIQGWMSKVLNLYSDLGFDPEASLLVNVWASLAVLIVMQLYSYERRQKRNNRKLNDVASEHGSFGFIRRVLIWHSEKLLSVAVFYASLTPISAFGFLYLFVLVICSTLPKTSRIPAKLFLVYTGILVTFEYLFQMWGKKAHMFPGQKSFDISLFLGFQLFEHGFWGLESGLRGKVLLIVACTLQYNTFHWQDMMPSSLVNKGKWEEPCDLFISSQHTMAESSKLTEESKPSLDSSSLRQATDSCPSFISEQGLNFAPSETGGSEVRRYSLGYIWGSSKESHKWNKKLILALKKERFEIQKTTLKVYMRFWMENVFNLFGLEISMIALLLASFAVLNVVSMFYVALLAACILLKREIIRKLWPIFVFSFASILVIEYFAMWKDLMPWIHPPTETKTHCHDCSSSSELHFDYCRKCWLGLTVDDSRMLVSYYFVFILSSFKLRSDRLASLSSSQTYHQMMSQRKASLVWRDLSFETKSMWTILDYLRLYSYCHLLDIVLALILITGTLEYDVLHFGYLFLALFFFPKRLEILKKKNKIFRYLRMYNFAVIVLSLAYQSPYLGYRSGECKMIGCAYEVIGFYKYDYGFRITSRSALVEIIIFFLVSIQSYIFCSREFGYVSRYLEAEQIGAIVHEQEKKAAWKTSQLQHIRKAEELKHQRNLQVEKMKSEMLNLQIQLHSMNSPSNFVNTSPESEGLRRRRNTSLATGNMNRLQDEDEMPHKQNKNKGMELLSPLDLSILEIQRNHAMSHETPESQYSPVSRKSESPSSLGCMKYSVDSLCEITEFTERDDHADPDRNRKEDKAKGKENPLVSAVQLIGDGVSQVQSLGNQAVTNIVSFLNIESEESESSGHSPTEDGLYDEVESQIHAGYRNIDQTSSVHSGIVVAPTASLQIGKICHFMWAKMRSHNDIVCYCCFVLVFLWNFSLLSMVYLAALFLYALCVSSGPSYLFWFIVLIYTELYILLQYCYQIAIQHCGFNIHLSILQRLGFPRHKITASFVMSTLPLFLVYVFTLLQRSITAKNGEWASVTELKALGRIYPYIEGAASGFFWKDKVRNLLSPVVNATRRVVRNFSRYWQSLTKGSETPPYFVQLSMEVDEWPDDGIQPERVESGINQFLLVAHKERCDAETSSSCHNASRVRVQSIERSQENPNIALAVFEVVYASPVMGCSKEEWYRSLTPASDVANEIFKAKGAGILDDLGLPYPVISVIGGGKREVDLYAYTFGADLAVFFLVTIFYQSVIKNNSKFLDVYQLEDQFPKEFVFILMVLFFLIVLDRGIYLCSFATGKVIFYLFNLVLFTYSVTEYAWYLELPNQRLGRLALRAIYLTKALSLALQAVQIRHGIPHKSTLYRQFLTSKVKQVNYLGFRLYRALPFLYELRCVLDWSCTATSLTMYDWLKLEDINASLYLVKCDADLNRAGHQLGQKQTIMTKFCSGICLFFILICVIWAPMLMYSSGNPTNIENPIKEVSVQVDIETHGGRLALYQTSICEKVDWEHLDIHSTLDPEHLLDTYNVKDIQLICCQADASASWMVPSVVQTRFVKSVDQKMQLIFSWVLTRDRPKGKEIVKYESPCRHQCINSSDVQDVLNGITGSFRIENVYYRYFRVTGSGEVRVLDQSVNSVVANVSLNKGSPPWWSFHDINATDVERCTGLTGPMAIIVSEETPQGILGETLSKFNIWSLYLTFVLAVGRFIRLQCSDLRMRIPYENLPSCERLIAICEDIYAARAEGELEVEEVLYWTLVKIYRSPHMLLEYTKPD
uniref:Protein PIEZO n=2 Tax=Anthurium amnicola TaxID=1678845 RepID=A0A1D1Y2D5_9ARAE